ncbi:DUF2756 domain-containing protein [Sulfurivermis fontis]|uniref:DUF2756 domain-containing protein n=1 Tax=Sulfurivermis fontis TaxID=1972068 RepID=UPI001559BB13|nr:DUF2756 domain-containing protein [Sulfurivermis fontis]
MNTIRYSLLSAGLVVSLLGAPAWAEEAATQTQTQTQSQTRTQTQTQVQEQTRTRAQERVHQADVEEAKRAENQKRLEKQLNDDGAGAQGGMGKGGGQMGGGGMGGSRMGGGGAGGGKGRY